MRTGFRRFLPSSTILIVLFFAQSARPADDDPAQDAIKKGVKYLQRIHEQGPNYEGGSNGMGSATLAGLALLESGLADDDPSLKTIINYVRANALGQTRTYEASLTIMFLDRLGQAADRPIIQLLAVRLMSGQGASGGWSYDCGYSLTAEDETRLKAMFLKENKLVGNAQKKDPAKKNVPRPDFPTTEPSVAAPKNDNKLVVEKPVLHPEVAKFARLINLGGNDARRGHGGEGDNSNTQFASLGLWCARKHGVPCEGSLALLDKRFRASQEADGGWGYMPSFGGSTPSMTCAGLVGLALGHGSKENVLKNKADNPAPKNDPRKGRAEPVEDVVIKNGLKCLGNYIAAAKGEVVNVQPPKGRGKFGKRNMRFMPDSLNSNLYFLWSLERVGVIYGLETIGNHDWYTWGADALVDTQHADGSWAGNGYPGANEEISTCFALLFLNRANVARDLSTALKGKFKDPGVAVLRGGGDFAKILPERLPVVPKSDAPATVRPDPKPAKENGDTFEAEAARLSNGLLQATADERSIILSRLRDSKGSVYTEALAQAAGKAMGNFQLEAREALARRLARMTPATLREMMKDTNREVRAAAASACGFKEDRQFVPDLITSLMDADALVIEAARISLKGISKEDFGPQHDASQSDKTKALVAWRTWWKTQIK